MKSTSSTFWVENDARWFRSRPQQVTILLGILMGMGAPESAYAQSGRDETVWVDTIPPGAEARALERDFARFLDILEAMDKEMDLFNLDGIHPHLEELYQVYAEMTGLLPRFYYPKAG